MPPRGRSAAGQRVLTCKSPPAWSAWLPAGAGPLIHLVTGERLKKGETLTDWRKRPLTPQQVQYAFDDVRYLLPIWERITEKLERLKRTDWAKEEFAALVRRSLEEEPGVERWRKVGGLGGLDRKKLAVVRALYQWREAKADRQNRPARTVVRDDLLLEIARRNPKEERDLDVMRGLQKKEFPEIVRVVREARALPADQWPVAVPRENDPPQVALVAGLLNAVLGDFCGRTQLAPGLAAPADVRCWSGARSATRRRRATRWPVGGGRLVHPNCAVLWCAIRVAALTAMPFTVETAGLSDAPPFVARAGAATLLEFCTRCWQAAEYCSRITSGVAALRWP